MRKVAAAVCFLFAGALLVLAGLALSQVWDPQAESADRNDHDENGDHGRPCHYRR